MRVWVHAQYSTYVEVRGQLLGFGYLPPFCGRVSLLSAAALCTQACWPMIFRVILLSLPPTSQQECWDCRCMPWHPALHGFWRLWATITFTGCATSPALVYAVLGIASSLKVTRTRGCVQAGDVHNVYTTLHVETSSTDAPATIPTAHTEKQVDWLI